MSTSLPVLRASDTETFGSDQVDRFGAIASTLCAVHCALVALLPAVFGVLGLGFLLSQRTEWAFTLIAIAFAAGALVLGRRHHRPTVVVVLLVLGITGLLASRGLEMGSGHHGHHGHHEEGHHGEEHGSHAEALDLGHAAGTGVGVTAGLFLVAGHLLELRARRGQRGALPVESA